MKDTFRELRELRLIAENDLWQAQLKEWPDSRLVSLHEVYTTWMTEPPLYLQSEMAHWDKTLGSAYGTDELHIRKLDRWAYSQEVVHRHRLQIANNVAAALQFPAFVFYECGKNDDGTYRYRGCRYGVEPPDYSCGFGRY